ncbi:MAG: glycosyltransferase family 4 protein [Candidatus Aminicenantes bacterium]|nr:glycosyltransferase family 4 protein [Candidatus Aminicenantes bacterium]MDH5384928.1 glycosyltransferase family 4 protein [Candidatus Aminicenantes bacterium]MDH5743199.1 glycosyltransferase family 4 protein [Candidatus Aminicenantes bacterium]
MRILITCKEFPHSKVIGGPIIIHNRLKHLSKKHLVSLAAFCHPEEEKYIPSVEPYCHDLKLVPFPPKRSFLRATWDFFTSPIPHYFLRVYGSSDMSQTIAEMVKKDRYDFVIAEYSVMGQFLHNNPDLPPVRRIMSVHECYYLARLKSYHHHRFGINKLREVLNLKGLKKYEFDMYRNVDKVLTLTHQGKDELLDISPDLDISVVPHGVDVEAFAFSPQSEEEHSIVFIGNYRHYPNIDAVLYFHENIWSRLKTSLPAVKFYVVGQAPPLEITRLSEDTSIIVTGTVDDVIPYLRKSKVFICPVRLGGGFRGKILEAMALGRPVVSTSLGAEGIPALNGENIILADEPEKFAKGILDLISNTSLYQKIQTNGRRLMEDKYAWETGVAVLENILEEMMQYPPLNQNERGRQCKSP